MSTTAIATTEGLTRVERRLSSVTLLLSRQIDLLPPCVSFTRIRRSATRGLPHPTLRTVRIQIWDDRTKISTLKGSTPRMVLSLEESVFPDVA